MWLLAIKVENFSDTLINVNSILSPQFNVLIGTTEEDITEMVRFIPDFHFQKKLERG